MLELKLSYRLYLTICGELSLLGLQDDGFLLVFGLEKDLLDLFDWDCGVLVLLVLTYGLFTQTLLLECQFAVLVSHIKLVWLDFLSICISLCECSASALLELFQVLAEACGVDHRSLLVLKLKEAFLRV